MAKPSTLPPNSRPEVGLQRWSREHREAAKASWRQLWRRPLMNMITWLTLAVALALPGMLIILLGQIQNLSAVVPSNHQMSVFLQIAIDEQQGQSITQSLREMEPVVSAQYVSATQALQEFSQASGLEDVFASLTYNPIPATVLIETADSSAQAMSQLAEQIRSMPEVDQVILNQAWVERIQILVSIGERGTWILTILLALGVILVMANATRLQLTHHQEEMTVMKLIGGTNTYLRRPFLYAAVWSGGISGILACMIMALALAFLQTPFGALALSFNSPWQLHSLSLFNLLVTITGSCALTLLATVVTVNKQLTSIDNFTNP